MKQILFIDVPDLNQGYIEELEEAGYKVQVLNPVSSNRMRKTKRLLAKTWALVIVEPYNYARSEFPILMELLNNSDVNTLIHTTATGVVHRKWKTVLIKPVLPQLLVEKVREMIG